MDTDNKFNEYRQYSKEQLLQFGKKIVSPVFLIGLFYFIFSDIYFRRIPDLAFTRILPMSFLLIFFIASFTKLVKKRPLLLITIYNLALFFLICMSYSISIITWNTSFLQTSVTALIVVFIAVFLGMRGPIINIVLIFFIPSLLFVIYIIIFMDNINKLADFANSFMIMLGAIALYSYDEKLRKSKFFTENQLIRANQKMKLMTTELKDQNRELQNALENVKQLSGLIPICSNCKKIRDDDGYWQQIEFYIQKHSEADFSHGICPECSAKLYPEFFEKNKQD